MITSYIFSLYNNNYKKNAKPMYQGIGVCSIPVINVYTDYFINQIWGIEAIDYHFVPSRELKEYLISRGIESERILVTGIPIHPLLKTGTSEPKKRRTYSILISGGNLGAGSIKTFV
jgi:UDP-N-acetylglucosamine:LPS N-acetylglucosamine transferase